MFPLLGITTHLHSRVLLQRLWFLFSAMRALKCQSCPSELRHFLEQIGRGWCWETIQAHNSVLICTGSQQGPPVIACPVSEHCLLSGLLEGVETVLTGSVIVVLIQLLLWKSVGTFCVSLAIESDFTSTHIWCSFTGSWKCLETTAWCVIDFCRPKTFIGLSHFFLQKAEFIVCRLKSRKGDLLCQLMDGVEAVPACNIPVLLLLCLSRKSHLGQWFAEKAEERRHGCFISRLCVSWKHSFFLCCLIKCIFCLSCCTGLTPGHADGTQIMSYFLTLYKVEISMML